ncbi:MAG: sensor histidine kinase [Rhodothermales bacterium]
MKRHRVQIVARALLLVALSLLLAYLAGLVGRTSPAAAVLLVGVGLLIAYVIASLVRYEERTAREVTRFLESVRYSDFAVAYSGDGRGPVFDELATAFSDVTDAFRRVRAESEARQRYLRSVVQHVGVALITFRDAGDVDFVNQATRRLLGIGRLRRVQDLAAVSPELAETLRTSAPGEQTLIKVQREDRTLQLAVRVSRFRLGDRAYALASLQDIGQALEEKEMEAWQQLTRVLTHEIMNSVAPIVSLAATAHRRLTAPLASDPNVPSPEAALASDALPSPEALRDVQEAVQIIEQRGEALMHFVDAYRSFTRIPTPQFEMIPVRLLLTRVARLFRTQMEDKGIACDVDVEPLDLRLTADPELVEQVLINLLLNAIQAVDGRPEARITLHARPNRRGIPVVQVTDNGLGIAPDVQERIFVPFFTTKADGSGIGLSLSRQILRLHGGTLRVRSKPGEGTTFAMRF